MEVKCRLNGENIILRGEPTDRLRDVLYHTGCYSVRDSDDAEGFAGSDTIIFNGQLKYSNFILLYQAEGANIKTAESLLEKGELNYVQKAMVAAGIVQSAYNAPAAALILTWLLEKHPNPTREQIKDVLTGIFIRDAGYEHYYLAVKLACELRDEGCYFLEYLAIGYCQTRADTRFLQKRSNLFRLQHDRSAMIVEYIPNHLYLRQNQSSGRCFGIDRGNQ